MSFNDLVLWDLKIAWCRVIVLLWDTRHKNFSVGFISDIPGISWQWGPSEFYHHHRNMNLFSPQVIPLTLHFLPQWFSLLEGVVSSDFLVATEKMIKKVMMHLFSHSYLVIAVLSWYFLPHFDDPSKLTDWLMNNLIFFSMFNQVQRK